jgi:multidrug efflux pump
MDNSKTELFESMPIPKAVVTLSVPTVISSLVMVIYNLADTYFVGMLNDPIQNAAVTLAAPVLLAFNADQQPLRRRQLEHDEPRARQQGLWTPCTRARRSAFTASLIQRPAVLRALHRVAARRCLSMLGANAETAQATGGLPYVDRQLRAAPRRSSTWCMAYLVRAEGASLHASIGTMSGCLLNILLDPIFVLPWGLNLGAAGAGCATFISNCVACLYFFVLLFVRSAGARTSASIRASSVRRCASSAASAASASRRRSRTCST